MVTVEWKGATNINSYAQAVANTKSMGALVGAYVKALRTGTSSTKFWCIGYDMGAHACGYSRLQIPNELMDRITGELQFISSRHIH